MSPRGTHYERSFAAYLKQRGIAHVAVDQTRKAMLAGAKIKSFDFLVYPRQGECLLVDVKGLKFSAKQWTQGKLGPNWVTDADIEGLRAWEAVFGTGHTGMFLFAYWLEDSPIEEFLHDNRSYVFYAVELNSYSLHMKQRSPKWRTVHVSSKRFRQIAHRLEEMIR